VTARAPAASWEDWLHLVQAVEALGFDSVWLPDHPALTTDSWTLLAALAGVTKRIRLGPLVSCVYYRSPLMLARHAADVDRISGGRLVLGLGIGWVASEFTRLNLPFPPVPERQRALAETIEIARHAWTEQPFSYQGTIYHLIDTHLVFGPVQTPRIPLLIAGVGEHTTLRQVAAYADMSNFDTTTGAVRTIADITRKRDVVRRYCDLRGRPYESVLLSHFVTPIIVGATASRVQEKLNALSGPYPWTGPGLLAGTPDDIIAFYRPLIAAGIRYFIGSLSRPGDLETVELLAEKVLPELQIG
jgi:alkanesulfonate monooxygenase SsuD/methylene tetrahydromethanopterin reductase-like flavin-dependent oxidoreductase (luciferase family)